MRSRTEEDEYLRVRVSVLWRIRWRKRKAKLGGCCGETARVGLLWQRRVNDGFSGDRLSCAGKIKWCTSAPGQGLWVWMRENLCLSCPTTSSCGSGGGDGREEESILVSLFYGDVSLQRGERSLAWLFVRCALKLLDSAAQVWTRSCPTSCQTPWAQSLLTHCSIGPENEKVSNVAEQRDITLAGVTSNSVTGDSGDSGEGC